MPFVGQTPATFPGARGRLAYSAPPIAREKCHSRPCPSTVHVRVRLPAPAHASPSGPPSLAATQSTRYKQTGRGGEGGREGSVKRSRHGRDTLVPWRRATPRRVRFIYLSAFLTVPRPRAPGLSRQSREGSGDHYRTTPLSSSFLPPKVSRKD